MLANRAIRALLLAAVLATVAPATAGAAKAPPARAVQALLVGADRFILEIHCAPSTGTIDTWIFGRWTALSPGRGAVSDTFECLHGGSSYWPERGSLHFDRGPALAGASRLEVALSGRDIDRDVVDLGAPREIPIAGWAYAGRSAPVGPERGESDGESDGNRAPAFTVTSTMIARERCRWHIDLRRAVPGAWPDEDALQATASLLVDGRFRKRIPLAESDGYDDIYLPAFRIALTPGVHRIRVVARDPRGATTTIRQRLTCRSTRPRAAR